MIEAVITVLIYICLLALAVYLIVWVLGALGISLPDPVMKIIYVIVALIAILLILRVILPHAGIRLVGSMLSLLV